MHYAIMLLLIASFVAPLPARAAEVKDSAITPSEVVAAYFEAYRNMEWARAAQYVLPKSLIEFKRKIMSIILRTEQSGQLELVEEFGVKSLASLEAMPPADFYGAANRRRWATLGGKQAEYLRSGKITILGTKATTEGAAVVSFTTRVDVEGQASTKPYEYVVLRHGDSWKIDLDNLIAAQGSIEPRPPNPGLQSDAPQAPRR